MLSEALAEDGGLSIFVYSSLTRSWVYLMQVGFVSINVPFKEVFAYMRKSVEIILYAQNIRIKYAHAAV